MKAKYIILVICIVLLLGIYINYFSPVHAADLETTTSVVTQTTRTYSEPTTKSAEVDDIPDTTEIASLETTELFDNKPLTPDGSGTVMDDVFDNDGKEIFSITTENGNVFYLIVDRQRESDNIYFLNAVTEEDLLALAQKKGIEIPTETSIIPTTEAVSTTENNIVEVSVPEPKSKDNTGGFDIKIIIIIIAVIGVIGAGYYFKIYKNKKKPPEPEDDNIDDYADEPDDSDDGDNYADSDDNE